jgi:hypothetical protein
MMLALPVLRSSVGFWLVRLASILMRSPELVAAQTLALLFAEIEVSAARALRRCSRWRT